VTIADRSFPKAFYDDPDFNYQDYWSGRSYEHEAEVIAIRRLLNRQLFAHAVDVGGGYGRLAVVLAEFAARVTLVDSSSQQLALAEAFLVSRPRITRRQMEAANLDFPDESVDLVTMVRLLHHLPEPTAELAEVHRILRPGGYAIIEVANIAHALNRLRYLVKRKPIPAVALDIRSEETRQRGGIAFVNHHPQSIAQLAESIGLRVESVLSVSNLRHRLVKKALPGRMILAAERVLQPKLARIQFGPSVFFLLRK
jgi:ubiquinone/menaquinone biosynthesis C-methylase UbiE